VIRTDRPRLNLALVIDRSGSMAEARKLDFVKTAAHHLVDMMGPDDLLSIVTYSQRVEIPGRPVPWGGTGDAPPDHLRLYPGGSTFLSGGLEEGFRQAKSGKRRGTLNRVLLLSDGLANVGWFIAAPCGSARGTWPNAESPSPRSESGILSTRN